jgi:hypothetical protein
MKRGPLARVAAHHFSRLVAYCLVALSSWTSGCIQHTEIDFVAYVREVAAATAGRDVTTVDNATRLGELGFQEADLGRLAKRLSEGTSEKITESDLKGLQPNGSWKDIRLYDIGCFVGRKVLDSLEAARRERDKKP